MFRSSKKCKAAVVLVVALANSNPAFADATGSGLDPELERNVEVLEQSPLEAVGLGLVVMGGLGTIGSGSAIIFGGKNAPRAGLNRVAGFGIKSFGAAAAGVILLWASSDDVEAGGLEYYRTEEGFQEFLKLPHDRKMVLVQNDPELAKLVAMVADQLRRTHTD